MTTCGSGTPKHLHIYSLCKTNVESVMREMN